MNEKTYKRRKRYSGKYPKRFEEKYKEQDPDKYQELIKHVMQKGNTPAGMHRPIMVDEILSFLNIEQGQIGLDATLGFGGHTTEILKKLNATGHLHATDVDSIELPKTKERLYTAGFTDNDFTLHHLNFKEIDKIDVKGFDFMIADLGVSSMQIDDPERGFTFKYDGPLDLRMNPEKGVPASIRLMQLTQVQIEDMLVSNADETYAFEIAEAITNAKRKGKWIETTKDLKDVVASALKHLPKSDYEKSIKKALQRTFQALRIDVNREYEALEELLEKIPFLLNQGGKVAILTFHSGEDRLVKKSFQQYYKDGIFSEISGPDIPTSEEVHSNPRSRSAKLRFAIKA